MSLYDRIMALPKRTPGQLDTVRNAAQIAKEADELMAEMAEALTALRHEMMESGNYNAEDFGWPEAKSKTNSAIDKYNAWKERTK